MSSSDTAVPPAMRARAFKGCRRARGLSAALSFGEACGGSDFSPAFRPPEIERRRARARAGPNGPMQARTGLGPSTISFLVRGTNASLVQEQRAVHVQQHASVQHQQCIAWLACAHTKLRALTAHSSGLRGRGRGLRAQSGAGAGLGVVGVGAQHADWRQSPSPVVPMCVMLERLLRLRPSR